MLLFILMPSALHAVQMDAPGCTDHPLFPERMPDYTIEKCENKALDAFEFETGKREKTRIEGRVTRLTYRIDDRSKEASGLAVVRSYTSAITKLQGAVSYTDQTGSRIVNGKIGKDGKEFWVQAQKGNGKIWLTVVETAGTTYSALSGAVNSADTGKGAVTAGANPGSVTISVFEESHMVSIATVRGRNMALPTGPDGKVTFGDLQPGIFDFTVDKPGYVMATGKTTITSGGHGTVSVEIKKLPSVTVTVMDGLYQVAGATVSGGGQALLTSPGGTAIFENLQPGVFDFIVDKPGYIKSSGKVTTIPGGHGKATVSLKKLPSVTVTVMDGLYQVAGATVAGEGKTLTTGPGGTVLFDNLQPGAFDFVVDKPGYIKGSGKVMTPPGVHVKTTVSLKKLPSVTFTIMDGIAPVAVAIVSARDLKLPTDPYGKVTFSNLQPGSFHFVVDKPGYIQYSSFTMLTSGPLNVTVSLKRQAPN
jgi:hypothetical protein